MEPTGGAGSLPPCGRRRRCRGARRGQRAAAPGAACSGTNCPILRQGPGPGPSPRINSLPAGPELPGRAAAAVLPAPPAWAVRPVLRPGDAAHCGRYPGPSERRLLDFTLQWNLKSHPMVAGAG